MNKEPISKCCSKCSGYFEHRVGSHSDDWGGDSDLPCDCNRDKCDNPNCECHITAETSQLNASISMPLEPTSTVDWEEVNYFEDLKVILGDWISQRFGSIDEKKLNNFIAKVAQEAEQRGAERERERIEGIIKEVFLKKCTGKDFKYWERDKNNESGADERYFPSELLDDILTSIKETK